MENFYLDNHDIQFHMKNMDLNFIASLKEDEFTQHKQFADAPTDYNDAMDSYARVLEVVGQICGEFIAPRATDVDREGAHLIDGNVVYAKGTQENLKVLKDADLLGFTLPRRYKGINMPKTIYSMATEMVSRADASLMNLFGLQEIGDTIFRFGNEEQRQKYLPLFATGEVTGAMTLTEPDAGSDLQSAMLRAFQDEHGEWRLNGVKRFITNGCADISLVMSRSEEGTTGGKGLSLFIYKRDKDMKVRRIEDKLGIHGSPTCELQFNNAKAELLGSRKMGLIKYTMSLMNGARLGVSAQACGIAEAAYRDAYKYANERSQFKKVIREFTAVYEMLTDMKVSIEASRTLLYETSRIVDVKEGIEEQEEHNPELAAKYSNELKKYTKLAAFFTPLLKATATEMANKVCYDAIQIHGGVGFTREFTVERYYRDARITNIYEGTTQLQVVAAIGGVTSGLVFERLDDYEKMHNFNDQPDLYQDLVAMRNDLKTALAHIKNKNDTLLTEFHSRRLVEMASDTVVGYLMVIDAMKSLRKKSAAKIFVSKAKHRVKNTCDYILSDERSIIELHPDILDGRAN